MGVVGGISKREELKVSRDGVTRLKTHLELIFVRYSKGHQEELLQPF